MKHSAVMGMMGIIMSVAFAGSAHAQFTAVVPPPPKKAPAPTQAQKVARADSVSKQTLSDMKTWVDSAAASLGAAVVDTSHDTTSAITATTPATTATGAATTERNGTLAFRAGAPAPNTATYEPLLFLCGVGALSLGVVLLRKHA